MSFYFRNKCGVWMSIRTDASHTVFLRFHKSRPRAAKWIKNDGCFSQFEQIEIFSHKMRRIGEDKTIPCMHSMICAL